MVLRKEKVMALVEWRDVFKTGFGFVDDQHKQLVQLTNELHDAMKAGKAKAVMTEIVASLKKYAVRHFGEEESVLDKFAYPERAPHKKEHASFVAKVAGFEKDLKEGKLALSIEVVNFLGEWLKSHIGESDKAYTPFMAGHGLK